MKRPVLFNYEDLNTFVRDMIAFRKQEDKDFTVAKYCEGFERCSTALVSSIASGKRKLTFDRVPEMAILLGLSARERFHLKERVSKNKIKAVARESSAQPGNSKRQRTSAFLLKNWLHPYVKDAVRLEAVKKNRNAIFELLGGIASKARIQQSLKFLLLHGYLRLNQEGQWVESEVLNVLGDRNASAKIRQFHKKTLDIARDGIEVYPMEERLAQALLLPLDEESYAELLEVIKEFAEKLQTFSETHQKHNRRLYQLILHLTPTGGIRE
ncbi:MAG: TIGR02147 family protein [Proteobacteria bacterium]|nr:MAG: TIGR02147 family protein [Pseudomonadota bacterium]